MAEFVLKNNYFEFNWSFKHQIGTAIETKFAPPYACIFMDYVERDFLKNEQIQPWIWFRYTDDIFFIWTASEKELPEFLNRLNSFHPNLRFTHERSWESLNFLDVIVKIQQGEFATDLNYKSTDGHQYLHFDFILILISIFIITFMLSLFIPPQSHFKFLLTYYCYFNCLLAFIISIDL